CARSAATASTASSRRDGAATAQELDAPHRVARATRAPGRAPARRRPPPPAERAPRASRVLETGKARLGAECLEIVQHLPQIGGEPLAVNPVGVEISAPALGGRRSRRRRARGEREGEGDEGSPVTHLSAGSPQKTGSGVSRTPNRSRTQAWSFAAKATMSRARAPSCATTASVWRVERPTRPSASPRLKPARSMSQAAESFTRPSGWAQRGIAGSRARASTRAQSVVLTIGFVKKDPQLRRFGSRG